MGRIRKIGVALVLSGVMAVGFGTTLSAASKKPGGGDGGGNGKDAICSYLKQIIDYEYTSPTVLAYVLGLYRLHGCGAE
jgi:hypothetical protein